jgi:hypothetical protein
MPDVGENPRAREAVERIHAASGGDPSRLDFSPARPETFTPAPELGAAPRNVFEEHGIDRNTGASLEETLARESEKLGPLPEEERAAFEKAAQEAESVRRIEEKGYEMMACVLKAKE